MKELHLFSDGGSRSNPGPAGIGFIIKDEKGKILGKKGEFIGEATNNVAEYKALIAGLGAAKKYKPQSLVCFLDSKLVVNQLKGLFKIKKGHLRELLLKAKELEQAFPHLEYRLISREKNREADKLLNQAIDEALAKPS